MSLRKQKQLERIYSIGRKLADFIIFEIFGAQIHGSIPCNVKSLLIVSNHISLTDPPIIGIVLYRLLKRTDLYFFAKEELFNVNPLFASILHIYKAIPLKRSGTDISTIRKGLSILNDEHVLVIFPEGTRNKTNGFLKGRAGAGYIALKSDVPFIPVYIANADKGIWAMLFRGKNRLSVTIGNVFHYHDKRANSANARITVQIMMREIEGLKCE